MTRTYPRLVSAILLIAMLSGLAGVVPAYSEPGVLYVDGAAGDDSGFCTDAEPCQTIARAIELASDGSTMKPTSMASAVPCHHEDAGLSS